jgi:hypothetical protein
MENKSKKNVFTAFLLIYILKHHREKWGNALTLVLYFSTLGDKRSNNIGHRKKTIYKIF